MSDLLTGFQSALRGVPALFAPPLSVRGVWEDSAVPPGTPHPFVTLFEGLDSYRFRNHQNDGPAETPVIVTVEDQQRGVVGDYSRAEAIADVIEDYMNRRTFAAPGRVVQKCIRENRRRRPAEKLELPGTTSVGVIIQFQVSWFR